MNDKLFVWVLFEQLVFGQFGYVELHSADFHVQNVLKTYLDALLKIQF